MKYNNILYIIMYYMDDNVLFIIIFACIMHNYISMMEYITAIFCKYRNRFESATSSLIELELDYVDTDSVKRYKDDDEHEYVFNNAYNNNDLHVIKCDKCSQVFDSRNKRSIHKKYYMCPYQHEIDKTVTTEVNCIDCESVFDNKYLLYMHIYSKKCTGRDTHVRHIRLDNRQQISDNSEKIVSSSQQIPDNGGQQIPVSYSQQIPDSSEKSVNSNRQIPDNLINYGSAYTYSDNNQVWEYFGNILIEPKIDNYKQIIFDEVNNKNILNDVQFAILTGENMNITNFNEIIHKIAEHLNSYCEIINNNEKQIESERKENEQYKNIIENYKIEIIALHKKISLLNDKLKNRITSDKTMLEDYDKKIKQYEASIKKYDTDAKKYKNTIEELNNKINNTKQMNNYLTSIMA
jgi:hypothetical protein